MLQVKKKPKTPNNVHVNIIQLFSRSSYIKSNKRLFNINIILIVFKVHLRLNINIAQTYLIYMYIGYNIHVVSEMIDDRTRDSFFVCVGSTDCANQANNTLPD